MELWSVSCGSLDGRGVWGRTDICKAKSFHCSPGTITTLLTAYIPMQNKKFKKKKSPLYYCNLSLFPNSQKPYFLITKIHFCIGNLFQNKKNLWKNPFSYLLQQLWTIFTFMGQLTSYLVNELLYKIQCDKIKIAWSLKSYSPGFLVMWPC